MDWSAMTALVQVVLIDLALAGDNAVAVGLAASALPEKQQRRAIFWGIVGALVLRVLFALITVQLLQFRGILLFGGVLLFWVAWRMWQDLSSHGAAAAEHPAASGGQGESHAVAAKPVTFGGALLTIVIADVSMSLDNVLAVSGVARHEPIVMAFGLVLSVILMGVAASVIARVLERYRWLAYVGIVVILFAAVRMIWEDAHVFFPAVVPAMPGFMGGHA